MTHDRRISLSRRALLGAGLTGTLLAACRRVTGSGEDGALAPRAPSGPLSASTPLPPTPHIDEAHDMPPAVAVCQPTADNIEGPFFKAGAPSRSVLVSPGDAGERLQVSGSVLSTDCRPLSGAEMDIWQADATGTYDLEGFRYRGRLRTAEDGSFAIDTIVPGRYLNGSRYRPAHIHIKLHAPGRRPLTTQLYFPGDPYNQGDPFIHRSLIMETRRTGALTAALFDFVLAA
jgi:protocatechuate 3,4-dioxygenase beta subunit